MAGRSPVGLALACCLFAGCSTGGHPPAGNNETPAALHHAAPPQPPPRTAPPGWHRADANLRPSSPGGGGNRTVRPVTPETPVLPKATRDRPDEFPTGAEAWPGFEVARSAPIFPRTDLGLSRAEEEFRRSCSDCHGLDGRGNANSRYHAPDLSKPYVYRYGSGQRALFRTLSYGIPKSPMAQYAGVLKEDEIWGLVHYLQALMKS